MHLPTKWMGFHHFSTEVFYNEAFTSYKVCDGSGEDKTCAGQFGILSGLSQRDHTHIFGTIMGCSHSRYARRRNRT